MLKDRLIHAKPLSQKWIFEISPSYPSAIDTTIIVASFSEGN
jgi:hypothetical protein